MVLRDGFGSFCLLNFSMVFYIVTCLQEIAEPGAGLLTLVPRYLFVTF